MKFTIPHGLKHSSMRLVVRVAKGWSTETDFDDSLRVVEVEIPAEVSEATVEAFIVPLLQNGQVDEAAVKTVLKAAERPRRGKPSGHPSRNIPGG